jgi:hypothetical protein
LKAAAWAAAAVLALLIIAARKHYTVDVVIAWYTLPMVYTLLHVFWRQRCSSNSSSCGSYAALPTTAATDDAVAVFTGKGGLGRCAAAVPASNSKQIELPSSWKGADCSCCSSDDVVQSAGSSGSYCSSYNISPRSDSGQAGGAYGGVSNGTSGGRTVSPRRVRSVWLFGHVPWRQQQQQELGSAASGAAEDLEAPCDRQ